MTLVAIHQPNFFPWLGYFDKIARADIFVFLDAVEFSSGSWTNRVKLFIGNEARWLTCPIVRSDGLGDINTVSIDDSKPWRRKALQTIEANYAKGEHYRQVIGEVTQLLNAEQQNLAKFNISAIKRLASLLGLKCRFAVHSELDVSGRSNQLLANLVTAVGGSGYLVGGGADGYQDNTIFSDRGIEVVEQNFNHPVYPQSRTESFNAGLSVLDAVMNRGFDETATMLGR